MTEPKIIKVKETKESFRERISDLLEDMWEKIGRYHEGMYRANTSPPTPIFQRLGTCSHTTLNFQVWMKTM